MKDKEFDISYLLKSKDFDSLNSDEQEFIISEIGGREKYQKLREFVLNQSSATDVSPPETIRENAMASFDAFHSKEKHRIGLWIPQRKWYRQPFTIALAAASILFAVFLIVPFGGENLNRAKIAENKPLKKEAPKTASDKSDSMKTLKSPDNLKEEEAAQLLEQSKNEIQSAELSIEKPKALKDINTNKTITNDNMVDNGSSKRLSAEEIAANPAPNDLQSMAVEVPSLAEISDEDEEVTFANDSNAGMELNNENSSAHAKTMDEKSKRRQSDTVNEMSLNEVSKTATRAENEYLSKETMSDIFLISQTLPDHYVAY